MVMVKVHTMEDLEDFLTEKLGDELPNFTIETLEDGQIVIFTGLAEDPDGDELMEVDDFEIDVENTEEENSNEDD
jgi:hypothetical protein